VKPYDEFETFRALSRRPPPRYEALDDLHRTLYGTLHPSAERIGLEDAMESDRALAEGREEKSWLAENAGLTAAIAVLGAFAVYAFVKRKPVVPLQGPPDQPSAFSPQPSAQNPNSPG
jgi:hypothetical protein